MMVSFLSEFIVIRMRKDNGKKIEMLDRKNNKKNVGKGKKRSE